MASPAWSQVRRRALAVALTVAVVAAVLVVGVRGPRDAEPPSGGGSATLSLAETGADLRALDVSLKSADLTTPRRGVYRSRAVQASEFTMVGLTWRGESAQVRLQVRTAGGWGPWREAEMLADGPDVASSERTIGLVATDLQWVGPSDAVRVEVAGATPRDLTLVLMEADGTVSTVPARPRTSGRALPAVKPRPTLLTRTDWGADDSLRSGTPTIDSGVRQVHIHHTVNANNYSRADVAGLIRGMYRYHTQNLGWSDIGYNFLVDRFGRIWGGRAGGPARAVRGAHTLGFNDNSTGIAVIGNFETGAPPQAVVNSLARFAAWKLYAPRIGARSRVSVVSTGSDRFSRGRAVRLPAIDGHRDTNETACPGRLLYAKLGEIRQRAYLVTQRFE